MASLATPRAKPWTPDTFEKILSAGAILLFIAAATAIARGQSQWHLLPAGVWWHLATIGIALALTPVMLLRKRGDYLHRRLGWIWVLSMIFTALISFDVRLINDGGFSLIHLLSVWTLIQVPLIVWRARRHEVDKHRNAVRGMVTGALLIAGFFTFPFGRLLGGWLFG